MDYGKIAQTLLPLFGGRENIAANATCMTRLRVTVKDASKVDITAIKNVEGVMGVVEQGTIQVVFGPGKVNKVGDEFAKLTGIGLGSADAPASAGVDDLANANKAANKAKQTNPVQVFLRKIANIFVPLLPGIIAAGLINGITNVINVWTGNQFIGEWWYQTIRTMGWALFAYLPIMVGMNAAKEFGGSPVLGAMAGAMSIVNPAMPLLANIGTPEVPASIILPIVDKAFNPAAGGLIAAMIGGMFFAILEKRIQKVMPDIVSTFFTPLLTVIIGSIVAVMVLQPIGAGLTQVIYTSLDFVYSKMGVFGGYILAATFLPLVSVGLHQALTPIHQLLNDPAGATHGINYLLPILMMAGGGQVGAGIALYVRTKNDKLKQYTRESLPVGLLGVGEPMMYAVTLPLGKSFITACLGAGFGGAAAAFFKLGAISQGVSGLFGPLIIQPGIQQLLYLVSMAIAITAGFLITYFFAVDHKRIEEVYGN